MPIAMTKQTAASVTTPASGKVSVFVDSVTSIPYYKDSAGNAVAIGMAIPQSSHSADYTTVITDGNTQLLHPGADTTARTFTIASNATVPYLVGTVLTFINQHAAGVLTIAITSDTMRLEGAGTTGSRTLAADGIANAVKIASTEWLICGGSSLT